MVHDPEIRALSEETAYLTLSKSITHDVLETLHSRNEKTRNILVGALTLLLTAAIAAITFLVPLYISDKMDQKFSNLRDAELEELYYMRDISTLTMLMHDPELSRSSGTSWTEDVRRQIERIDKEYLAKLDLFSRRRIDFRARLTQLANDAINSVGKSSSYGEFAALVGTLAPFSSFEQVEAHSFCTFLTRDFLGSPNGASDWLSPAGSLKSLMATYETALKRAADNDYPEMRLAYDLVRLHMEDSAHPKIASMIAEISKLETRDQRFFKELMTSNLTHAWRGSPDDWSQRISDRMAAFLRDFADQDPLLSEVYEEHYNLVEGFEGPENDI